MISRLFDEAVIAVVRIVPDLASLLERGLALRQAFVEVAALPVLLRSCSLVGCLRPLLNIDALSRLIPSRGQ